MNLNKRTARASWIRNVAALLAFATSLLHAQSLPPAESARLLERTRQILAEALQGNNDLYRCLATATLYRHHNRMAVDLVQQNRVLPCGNEDASIDPMMLGIARRIAAATLPYLEQKLENGNDAEKSQAVYWIALTGGDNALRDLAGCARREHDPMRYECFSKLESMGRQAIPVLTSIANSEKGDLPAYAVSILDRLTSGDREASCARWLKDQDFTLRFGAARCLAASGDPRGMDVLREALRSPQEGVPFDPSVALAALGDPEQVAVVRDLIHRPFRIVYPPVYEGQAELADGSAFRVPRSLTSFKTEHARKLISTAFERKDYRERVMLAEALPHLKSQLDTDSLLRGLNDPDPRIRVMAAKVADERGDSEGMKELGRAVKAADFWARKLALSYLSYTHTPGAAAILRLVLQEPITSQRHGDLYDTGPWEAVAGIAAAGDASDVPALLRFVETSPVEVQAIYAIVRLSASDAAQLLAPYLGSQNKKTAICVAASLAYLVQGEN